MPNINNYSFEMTLEYKNQLWSKYLQYKDMKRDCYLPLDWQMRWIYLMVQA